MKADIDWLFDPVRFGLFLVRDKRKEAARKSRPFFGPKVAEGPRHPPLTTQSLPSMNLPTATRTRPSRTRLPISHQGLVDNPRSGTRRAPERTVWPSRSIDVIAVIDETEAVVVKPTMWGRYGRLSEAELLAQAGARGGANAAPGADRGAAAHAGDDGGYRLLLIRTFSHLKPTRQERSLR